MTSRRFIFKLFAGAVMASAMDLCGMRPVSMRRHSDPICLLDARSNFNFSRQIEAAIAGLKRHLPEGERFFLRWVNVYDKQMNPNGSTGYFLAIPHEDAGEKQITVDERGFLDDFLRMI